MAKKKKLVKKKVAKKAASKPAKKVVKTPTAKKTSERNEKVAKKVADAPKEVVSDKKPKARPERKEENRLASPPVKRAKAHPGSEYLTEVYFNRKRQEYVASVVEMPEIKAHATTREEALSELELSLEDHVEICRRRGETLPLALREREYPEKIEVPLSQKLYRQLDTLSRRERVALEQIVVEMISAGIEKRNEAPRRRETSNNNSSNRSHHNNNNNNRHRNNNRQSNNNRNFNGNGNYRDNRGNNSGNNSGNGNHNGNHKDNFMEYVRNLEKGQGNTSRY